MKKNLLKNDEMAYLEMLVENERLKIERNTMKGEIERKDRLLTLIINKLKTMRLVK